MNTRLRSLPILLLLAAVTVSAFAQTAAAPGDDARAVLKRMSDYVATQPTIELTFDSDIEIITPQVEKIQFASSGELSVQRPDKIRAHRKGGWADVDLVFDGKTASVLGRSMNGYTQFSAPGTLDQLIEALRAGYGVALPAADLLKTNSYELLLRDVREAKYIGHAVIEGVLCDHLAFRNFETDWQLWVEAGDRPVPRKMVITSKTVAGAPQYTVQIKSWKSGGKLADNAFVFTPPAGAKKVSADDLIDLDELPKGAPSGGK